MWKVAAGLGGAELGWANAGACRSVLGSGVWCGLVDCDWWTEEVSQRLVDSEGSWLFGGRFRFGSRMATRVAQVMAGQRLVGGPAVVGAGSGDMLLRWLNPGWSLISNQELVIRWLRMSY